MIHLRKRILSHLLRPPSPVSAAHISPLFSPHRLLSATKCVAPNPFAIEDYLVSTCGLTREQALKSSKWISHLKHPSNPDAVLAFLSDLGLSRAEVATVVAKDPRVLCADVGRTLAPRVAELADLGLSRPDIARLFILGQNHFRHSSLRLNLEFWISVFGSLDQFLQALKINGALLSKSIEKVAKPNLALLEECGISVSDVTNPNAFLYRMLTTSPKHLQEALTRVHEFGIHPSSSAFSRGLRTFAVLSSEKLTKNIQLLEKLGWSRDAISLAVRREPTILGLTEERVRRSLEFLIGDVGLEIPYIARMPALMNYSIDRRLLPRNCLMNFLKAKGLFSAEFSFFSIATISNEKFLHKYVRPYEESFPGLAAAFASSCAGKHQWEQLYETTCKKRNS
ncbi:hypothetical protein SETIT_4G095400v2 [Setaria italica]|uniref:Uncharacterized protein n=1 Tax=Setaria italica TaxID=4555 RepID=K3Y3M6_SETIT|nr:uncharacterized protein LOC101752984 [Setaria italica]RCV20904.1 hypothetical protein SETIT_4G095400v2 [Setaria italica]